MGNKLCCFCQEEEEYPAEENERNGVEEIALEEVNVPVNPQEPENAEPEKDESEKDEPIYEELEQYRSESPQYLEMRPGRSPSYVSVSEPTTDGSPEIFRLRVIAEQCWGTESEFRKFYDTTTPMTPDMDSSTSECLSHISVYNTEMERIMDATYINALKPNSSPEYVIYNKRPELDIWQLDISSGVDRKINKRFFITPMNTVQLWAMTTHIKNGKEDHGVFHLSEKTDKIKLAPCMKNSTIKVVHTTAYNLDMKKIRDMVFFEAKRPKVRPICYIQSKDPETGKIFHVSNNSPHYTEPFWLKVD